MALGRNHRIFNIGNSSGSYGISRVYHDETLSGDGTLSSLLGVVGGAGDTEVNEFVYNNSGDIINVDNVVQSNSANWNDISAYQENSGSYQPSGNYIPYTGTDYPNVFKTNSALMFQESDNRQSTYLGNYTIQLRHVDILSNTNNAAIITTGDLTFKTKSDSAYVDMEKIHKWDNTTDFVQSNSANYATTGELNNVSSYLSGAIDYVSANAGISGYSAGYGIDITNDIISVDNTVIPDVSAVSAMIDAASANGNLFIAEYGVTTWQETLAAINNGKYVVCKYEDNHNIYYYSFYRYSSTINMMYFGYVDVQGHNAYRANLAAIGSGHWSSSTINLQSDWNESSTASLRYIANKPDLSVYSTTSEVNTLSSMLSGAIDYVSANAGDEFPSSANDAITAYQTNSGTYITNNDLVWSYVEV